MDDEIDSAVVAAGLAAHPGAAVLILPRADGQYSNQSPDILALLDEAGVVADYATDPMATGLHSEKSADLVMPILYVIGSIGDWMTTIDGLIFVAKFFLNRVGPKGTARFRSTYLKTAAGDVFQTVSLDLPGDVDPTQAIRAAMEPIRRSRK